MMDDILKKIDLHKKRAANALLEIKTWGVLSVDLFEDYERVKTVDSFIYRFIKLQDMMGDKLFRLFLDEIGEYKDSMSLIDVLDKLEKFNIVDNAEKWIEYRKLRNKLTHEYPNNEQEIIEGIYLAIESFDNIDIIINNIVSYIRKTGWNN